jgi:hypothetical protein
MDTQRFGEGLAYVDAEELHRADAGLMVGAEIRDRNQEKVGELDGFVVDAASGRPRYAVVDAGGWFKSNRFLLPIGHLEMSTGSSFTTDLDKQAVAEYPSFDQDDWLRASADERLDFEYETLTACCPDQAADGAPQTRAGVYDRWPHYHEPAWWRTRAKLDWGPHLGGRAQPGDVIGIETDGERSYLGDTGEDEDERRQSAEQTVEKKKSK